MPFDDLQKKLYGPLGTKKSETKLPTHAIEKFSEPPGEWDEETPAHEPSLIEDITERYPIKKFLIWGMVAVGVPVVFFVAYVLYQALTFSGITLEAEVKEPVLAGIPFDVTVQYTNNSPSLLTNTKLLLSLPSAFAFVGADTSKRVTTEEVGAMGAGTIGQKVFRLIAVGSAATCQDITATLAYSTTGVGSRFEKEFLVRVCVSANAIALDVEHANQVLSNETFGITIHFRNVSDETLKNLELRMSYPQNFTFKNATINPDLGDNLWRLGDLRPGSENEIIVQGSVIAQADSFFDITATLVSAADGEEYVVAERSVSVSISPPPLAILITLNDRTDHIVKPGELLIYTLTYRNTTDVGFRDVVIKAKLIGAMFDFTSIDPQLNFNSLTNEFTWNKSHIPSLGLITPGSSGSVNFRMKARGTFPISRLSDKDFTLKVEGLIDSPTVPPFVAAERTVSVNSLESKVEGLITIEASGYFRDAASGIINSGPVPPKVNVPTQYTVHWIIRNYGTDVANVQVKAFLGSGVRATGVVKSTIDTAPAYNERTQEVIWNIPKIQATRGVISEPIEGIFQIEFLPAVNHVNSSVDLIRETSLAALDLFTNVELSNTANGFNTSLNGNDPTIGPNDGKVQP